MIIKRFVLPMSVVFFGLCMPLQATGADVVERDYEFAKKHAVSSAVSPVTVDGLTGEQVSQFDGALSFQVVDVSVPGNSALRVEVGRTWARDMAGKVQVKAFQDWDLDVPSIGGAFSKAHGWKLPKPGINSPLRMDGAQYVPDAFHAETAQALTASRCSAGAAFHSPVRGNYAAVMPPTFNVRYFNRPATPYGNAMQLWQQIDPSEYWSGYHVNVPGAGKQQLLVAAEENNNRPSGDYGWVTESGWVFTCISADDGGEGFLALSPQGEKYYFDHLVYRPYWRHEAAAADPASYCTSGCNSNPDIPGDGDLSGRVGSMTAAAVMERVEGRLYASRVEDRFGNWVRYDWVGDRLDAIRANDGREIRLFYNQAGVVERVVNGVRTWSYSYSERSVRRPWDNKVFLTAVSLPGGGSWGYELARLSEGAIYLKDNDWSNQPAPQSCQPYGWNLPLHPTIGVNGELGVVKAPSGVEVRYLLQPRRHSSEGINAEGFYPHHPTCFRLGPLPYYDELSLVQKEVVGPHASYKWSYDYTKINHCADGLCIPADQVSVTKPDGAVLRSVFGVRASQDMRWLLSTELLVGGSVEERVDYVKEAQAGIYPARIGHSPMKQRDVSNGFDSYINYEYTIDPEMSLVGKNRPLQKKTTKRGGSIFAWTALAFDRFARPSVISKANSLGYSQEERFSYVDDISRWVIGLPAANHVAGLEISRREFDAGTLLPLRDFSYQRLAHSLTHYPDGTIKTVTDGNSRTTTVSNWKRGIPQTIHYHDGSSESASVDDNGWIRSVTDEGGATTRYDYDLRGRLKLIDYPDGDSVDWANTVLDFAQVNADEYGIGPGHWRQTVTTGNQRKTTYFDGLWRPLVEREEDLANPATVRVSGKRFDHEGRVTDAYYPQPGSLTSHAQFAKGVHSTYDALGRVTESRQDAEGGSVLKTSTQYLPGLETLVIDPRNQQTRTRFAALDQPSYEHPVKQYLPEGVEVTIARDAFFKPIQLSRGGPNVATVDRFYFYDAHQRLCRTLEPETGSSVTAYDGASNVAWTASGQSIWGEGCGHDATQPAHRIAHTYDARNRLTVRDVPGTNADEGFQYGPSGEVKQARLGPTVWDYEYNKRGLLTKEILGFDGDSQSVSYGYDALGHLARTVYPSGRSIDYAPNALGQPTQVGGYVTGVRYTSDGAPEAYRYGNGIVFSGRQNDRRLPSNLTYAAGNGTLLYSQDLSYDANANLSTVSDLAGNGPSRSKTLGYDGLNRLTSAVAPALWGTETYRYDALDNLRERLKDGQAYVYNYDALNRLSNVTAGGNAVYQFGYDLRGNVTAKNSDTLIFDQVNRLQAHNGKQSYAYDAWGRRVRKIDLSTGAETRSLYNKAGQLLREHDSTANARHDYLYLGSKMVGKVSDGVPKLTAPSMSGGGHTLSWEASPSAVRYIVEESTNFGDWTQAYSGTATTWSAGGKSPGTYRYRVRMCRADGSCSLHTSPVTVKVGVNLIPIIYELLLN